MAAVLLLSPSHSQTPLLPVPSTVRLARKTEWPEEGYLPGAPRALRRLEQRGRGTASRIVNLREG